MSDDELDIETEIKLRKLEQKYQQEEEEERERLADRVMITQEVEYSKREEVFYITTPSGQTRRRGLGKYYKDGNVYDYLRYIDLSTGQHASLCASKIYAIIEPSEPTDESTGGAQPAKPTDESTDESSDESTDEQTHEQAHELVHKPVQERVQITPEVVYNRREKIFYIKTPTGQTRKRSLKQYSKDGKTYDYLRYIDLKSGQRVSLCASTIDTIIEEAE
jgi:hypothetical protein